MTPLDARVSAALEREPLSAISAADRAELDAALAGAAELEDLPGKWQAAILTAEAGGAAGTEPADSPGGCCHGHGHPAP